MNYDNDSASSATASGPAGWYPMDGQERFWDGSIWTDSWRPAQNHLVEKARRAGNAITQYLIWGTLISLVGGGVIGYNWPETTLGVSYSGAPNYIESGDPDLVTLGFFIIAVGQAMLLVGLIASGVRLGREASPAL